MSMTYKQFKQLYNIFNNTQAQINKAPSTDDVFAIMNNLFGKIPTKWCDFLANTPVGPFGDMQDHFYETLEDAKYRLQHDTDYLLNYNFKNVIDVQTWNKVLNTFKNIFNYQRKLAIGCY